MKADNLAMKMTVDPPALGEPSALRTRPILEQVPAGPLAKPRGAMGRDEQCDKAFEDDSAAAAWAAWEADAPRRERERRKARGQMTLGERLDAALLALESMSTVAASPLTRSSKSAEREGEPGPPKAQTPQVDANLRVIAHHVAQIEHALDAERGLVRGAAHGRLTTEEKDRIVWDDFEGVRAEDVARAAPYLGTSGRTIMRAREREAFRRKVTVRLVDGKVTGRLFDGDDTAYDV